MQLVGQESAVPLHTYAPHDCPVPEEPAASGAHTPFWLAPSTLEQTSQPSLHAVSQQKPSTQNPVEHVCPVVHACPMPAATWHVDPMQS